MDTIITLLKPPNNTRSFPIEGERLFTFFGGKPIKNPPDTIIERCRFVNKVSKQPEFKIEQRSPITANKPDVPKSSDVVIEAKKIIKPRKKLKGSK